MVARNGKAKLVGVMGDPITHSLSPAIHEYWLQKYDINGAYVPLRVHEQRFAATVETLLDVGFVGFNVTLPHKERAFQLAHSHDTASSMCMACNTLVVQTNGTLHGMNSDSFGFIKMLEYMQQLHPLGKDTIIVLGAGGAARAVVLSLQMMGVKHIIIANRTLERAESLVQQLAHYAPDSTLTAVHLDEATSYGATANAIINSISLDGNLTETITPLVAAAHEECWVVDLSYGKGGTLLTRLAAQHQRRTIDGLTMLLWQAVSGFEQWFGVTPTVDAGLVNHIKDIMRL
jgi:shikimate dehydrogenase